MITLAGPKIKKFNDLVDAWLYVLDTADNHYQFDFYCWAFRTDRTDNLILNDDTWSDNAPGN